MIKLLRFIFIALAAVSVSALVQASQGSAFAAQPATSPPELRDCHKQQPLSFVHGQYSARVSDVVLRDEVVCYAFSAKKGQKLTITREGAPQSTDLIVYTPGYRFQKTEAGDIMVGKHLLDVSEETYAASAVLPESGRYTLAVIVAHGGAASYTVAIALR